jgi:DNA-binding winged helix-turn-helix (wHTH) protein
MIAWFGSFGFDVERRRVTCGPAELHLTPKAFDLLAILVEQAPRVVRKSELHERLWPRMYVSDSALLALVKELRRVLGGDGTRPVPIRTAHRVGYALDTAVRRGEPLDAPITHWVVVSRRRTLLHPGENVIGRGEDADVRLDGTTVSRHHARLVVAGAQTTLDDLGSKNGTCVDGARVAASVTLASGARIEIGSVALTYYSSDSGKPTETHAKSAPDDGRAGHEKR